MFTNQIVSAIEGARSDAALVTLNQTIWQGLAAGALTDDDAQALADAIHVRRQAFRASRDAPGPSASSGAPRPGRYAPRRLQRSPDRQASIERRRRLALSGPLPPTLRAMFTTGELAVLRIVGDEVRDRGYCDRSLAEIAARAGVCRSHAHATLKRASGLGLLTITERRQPGRLRSLTNVVRITSREWLSWLRRGLKLGAAGEVFRNLSPTDEGSIRKRGRTGKFEPSGGRDHHRPPPRYSRSGAD